MADGKESKESIEKRLLNTYLTHYKTRRPKVEFKTSGKRVVIMLRYRLLAKR